MREPSARKLGQNGEIQKFGFSTGRLPLRHPLDAAATSCTPWKVSGVGLAFGFFLRH
jgi:hypothetical protein